MSRQALLSFCLLPALWPGFAQGQALLGPEQAARLRGLLRDAAGLGARDQGPRGSPQDGRAPGPALDPRRESKYLKDDRLTEEAAKLLRDYFSRKDAWIAFPKLLENIAAEEQTKLLAFGEEHGIPGNQVLVSMAMEALKPAGYSVVFIEVSREHQAAIDCYLAGPGELDGLVEKCRMALNHPGKAVLEAAKRLGLRVVAMDAPRRSERGWRFVGEQISRDQAMHEVVSSYLKARPEAKGIVFTGALHCAYDECLKTSTASLLKRLRQDHGKALKNIHILPGSEVKRLSELTGIELPKGSAIAGPGSPVQEVPAMWTNLGLLGYHIWPFSDFDYHLTQP